MLVSVLEGEADLDADPGNDFGRKRTVLLDDTGERNPIDKGHGIIGEIAGMADIVDGNDVGMGEFRRDPCLAQKPLAQTFVAFKFLGKQLQGNRTVEAVVLREEYHRHAAASQLLEDSVPSRHRPGEPFGIGRGCLTRRLFGGRSIGGSELFTAGRAEYRAVPSRICRST